MNVQTSSLLVAVWGAVLSTCLAGIKLGEVWRDRHRIDIGFSFSTDESQGNTISIRNVSGRPLILSYWELIYGTGHWPFRKFSAFQWPDHDEMTDLKIDAYSTHTLTFADADHFDWQKSSLKERRLYIRLHFAGRRPSLCLVYPSSA